MDAAKDCCPFWNAENLHCYEAKTPQGGIKYVQTFSEPDVNVCSFGTQNWCQRFHELSLKTVCENVWKKEPRCFEDWLAPDVGISRKGQAISVKSSRRPGLRPWLVGPIREPFKAGNCVNLPKSSEFWTQRAKLNHWIELLWTLDRCFCISTHFWRVLGQFLRFF